MKVKDLIEELEYHSSYDNLEVLIQGSDKMFLYDKFKVKKEYSFSSGNNLKDNAIVLSIDLDSYSENIK